MMARAMENGSEDAPPSGALPPLQWKQLQESFERGETGASDANLPAPRHGHRCVLMNLDGGGKEDAVENGEGPAEGGLPPGPQMLSLFGGDNGLFNEFWSYGLETGKWQKLVAHPEDDVSPTAAFAVATAGSKVYMYGGVQEGEKHDYMISSLFELDVSTMEFQILYEEAESSDEERKPLRDAPDSCLGAAMVHVPPRDSKVKDQPGKLYVFGGLNADHAPLDQLLSFDLATRKWATIDAKGAEPGQLPQARESASMVLWDNGNSRSLILYGGMVREEAHSRQRRANDVWALHIDENPPRWEELTPRGKVLPNGRSLHTAHIQENKMIVFGGWTEVLLQTGDFQWEAEGSTWILDLETMEWSERKAVDGPNPRAGHGSVLHGCELTVFGGNIVWEIGLLAECGNDLWQVRVAPPLPAVDVAVDAGPDSARITWSDRYPSQTDGYQVQVTDAVTGERFKGFTTGTELTVSDLNPTTSYFVELFSSNEVGKSDWWGPSKRVEFKTARAEQARPKIIAVEPSGKAVRIQWQVVGKQQPGQTKKVKVSAALASVRGASADDDAAPKKARKSVGDRVTASAGFEAEGERVWVTVDEASAQGELSVDLDRLWDKLLVKSHSWHLAERYLSDQVGAVHAKRTAEASTKIGHKRPRPDEENGEVSIDFTLGVEFRIELLDKSGAGEPSDTAACSLTRTLSKAIPEVDVVPPTDERELLSQTVQSAGDAMDTAEALEIAVDEVPAESKGAEPLEVPEASEEQAATAGTVEPPKRKRGRPSKAKDAEEEPLAADQAAPEQKPVVAEQPAAEAEATPTVKKKLGRPPKVKLEDGAVAEPTARQRTPSAGHPKPQIDEQPKDESGTFDPLALKYGTEIRIFAEEFDEWYRYAALWYANANLMDGKGNVAETGLVLFAHPLGWDVKEDVYVFLNEDGRNIIRAKEKKPAPFTDKRQLELEGKQACWFEPDATLFVENVKPSGWGITLADVDAIRSGPWIRTVWKVPPLKPKNCACGAQRGLVEFLVEKPPAGKRKSRGGARADTPESIESK